MTELWFQALKVEPEVRPSGLVYKESVSGLRAVVVYKETGVKCFTTSNPSETGIKVKTDSNKARSSNRLIFVNESL